MIRKVNKFLIAMGARLLQWLLLMNSFSVKQHIKVGISLVSTQPAYNLLFTFVYKFNVSIHIFFSNDFTADVAWNSLIYGSLLLWNIALVCPHMSLDILHNNSTHWTRLWSGMVPQQVSFKRR